MRIDLPWVEGSLKDREGEATRVGRGREKEQRH